MPSLWSAFARRGLTSPSPQTLLSASRARPTPTSKTPWRLSAASALPAPSPLNIARAPGRRQRLHSLQSLLDEEAKAFDAATVGRKLKVLFERQGRKPGQIAGRSPYLQA